MDQKRIDRLFREKLNSYEAVPSSSSWDEVKKQIDSKNSTPIYYWVAASITLLIVSWVLWPKGTVHDLTPIASAVNQPSMQKALDWSIPEPEKVEKSVATETTQPVMVEPDPATSLVAEEKTQSLEAEQPEEILPLELESKTAVAEANVEQTDIDEVLSTEEALIKVDITKIKITYIASSTPKEKPQEVDSLKGFKKFIAFAGKLSPGDVLADIREAKDDFISSGFKSKNKDKSSL